MWGVDISKYQESVDWKRVASRNPPDFVFVKATEGTLIVDPHYAAHARQLDRCGLLWGAYHFFGHRTSGKDQARSFIRTARLKRGNLRPVLDIEPHRFMVDPKRSVAEAKEFCREIRRYYGVDPIIYCSANFYDSYLRRDFPSSGHTLWIADYRGNPSHIDWTFWQHTDSYRLSGARRSVDRNVFSGTPDDLEKYIL
jgi:lysozyme